MPVHLEWSTSIPFYDKIAVYSFEPRNINGTSLHTRKYITTRDSGIIFTSV